MKDKFICETCKSKYPWLLEGKESTSFKKECAYCSGFYIDGTPCSGKKKKK